MKHFLIYRVYKKSSPNNKLTLYLASRDLIVSEGKIDKLQGVLLVDPDYLQEKRVKHINDINNYYYLIFVLKKYYSYCNC